MGLKRPCWVLTINRLNNYSYCESGGKHYKNSRFQHIILTVVYKYRLAHASIICSTSQWVTVSKEKKKHHKAENGDLHYTDNYATVKFRVLKYPTYKLLGQWDPTVDCIGWSRVYADPVLDLNLEYSLAQTSFLVTIRQRYVVHWASWKEKKKPSGRFLKVKGQSQELRLTM